MAIPFNELTDDIAGHAATHAALPLEKAVSSLVVSHCGSYTTASLALLAGQALASSQDITIGLAVRAVSKRGGKGEESDGGRGL